MAECVGAGGGSAANLADEMVSGCVSAAELGEWIVSHDSYQHAVVHCIFERILFACAPHFEFVACLRCATNRANIPTESGKARLFLWAFAETWTVLSKRHGTGILSSSDAAAALAFSGVMLSHNLHGIGVGSRRVSRSRFVEGCRCLDEVSDVPDEISGVLYDSVEEMPLNVALASVLSTTRMESLDAQAVAKQGWLMVKELDKAFGDSTPWRRCWTRIYENDIAMFITPQQWGIDDEIMLSIPLHGLVVTGVGDKLPSVTSKVSAQDDAREKAGVESGAKAFFGAVISQEQEFISADGMQSSCHVCSHAELSENTEGEATVVDHASGNESFLIFMGSSQERLQFPRLLLSAAGDVGQSREWAEIIIQRIQMVRFRAGLQTALQDGNHQKRADAEDATDEARAALSAHSKRPKAWGASRMPASRTSKAPRSSAPACEAQQASKTVSDNAAGGGQEASFPASPPLEPTRASANAANGGDKGRGRQNWLAAIASAGSLRDLAAMASESGRPGWGAIQMAGEEAAGAEASSPCSSHEREAIVAASKRDVPLSDEAGCKPEAAGALSREAARALQPPAAVRRDVHGSAGVDGEVEGRVAAAASREAAGNAVRDAPSIHHTSTEFGDKGVQVRGGLTDVVEEKGLGTRLDTAMKRDSCHGEDGEARKHVGYGLSGDCKEHAGRESDDVTKYMHLLLDEAAPVDGVADGHTSSSATDQQRIRDLESIVRFREWEANCLHQDVKIALNTALWSSIAGPTLHAVSQHVRARRRATEESLHRRRVSHARRNGFVVWHQNALSCRLRRIRCKRAEHLLLRHRRALLCGVLAVWADQVTPAPPSWQKPIVDDRVPVETLGGGCVAGIFRCFGGGERKQGRYVEGNAASRMDSKLKAAKV